MWQAIHKDIKNPHYMEEELHGPIHLLSNPQGDVQWKWGWLISEEEMVQGIQCGLVTYFFPNHLKGKNKIKE